ncbi:MAG: fibronectin type III domain-containing protein [Candidatus Eisenbacteria bacterium]|nr:fibronectin type III domain-containing protein [Candidatus Eisenbacteria bacterium]
MKASKLCLVGLLAMLMIPAVFSSVWSDRCHSTNTGVLGWYPVFWDERDSCGCTYHEMIDNLVYGASKVDASAKYYVQFDKNDPPEPISTLYREAPSHRTVFVASHGNPWGFVGAFYNDSTSRNTAYTQLVQAGWRDSIEIWKTKPPPAYGIWVWNAGISNKIAGRMDSERIIGGFYCYSMSTMSSWGVATNGPGTFFGFADTVGCEKCDIMETIIARMGCLSPWYGPQAEDAVRFMTDDVTLVGHKHNQYNCRCRGCRGHCVDSTEVQPLGGCNRLTWTAYCEYTYCIYRSDHPWGPYVQLTGNAEITTEDLIHFTCMDNTVEYSRPYWYRFWDDVYVGSGTPEGLPEPTLPSRPTGLIAVGDTTDCGDTVFLSWGESAGADSYYVFRCVSETLDECVPVPEFLGSTTSLNYADTTAGPELTYSYSVLAWNETGSSEESAAVSIRKLENVSPTASLVWVNDDNLLLCPGGDADSLVIGVILLDVCGAFVGGEPPSEVYAVLVKSEGDVHVCGGDTLRPSSATDGTGHTQIVAHHIGGCGTVGVRVYAEGQVLAQQPTVVLRGPDLNADGAVDLLDWVRWVAGGECTDLNWDGIEGNTLDWIIFNAHWPHTANPTIAVNAPNGSEWWNDGDEKEITWQFTPTQMRNAYNKVDLSLSVDGGATYTQPIDSLLANDGSCVWTIPQELSSGECKVRAIARDVHGCSVSDVSDTCFAIAAVKSGFVATDTTWGSPVSVVGDVVVVEGARLDLVPGAVVRFDTLDALQGGADTGKCELIVMGGIEAQGSEAKRGGAFVAFGRSSGQRLAWDKAYAH